MFHFSITEFTATDSPDKRSKYREESAVVRSCGQEGDKVART